MNKEERDNRGMIVNFNEPSNPEELNMMFENGIYPAVFRFPVSYEYLVGQGDHYVQLADIHTYGDFYQLEVKEKDNVYAIIPKDRLEDMILVASTELNNNDATFIDLSGEKYNVSDYAMDLKNEIIEGNRGLV